VTTSERPPPAGIVSFVDAAQVKRKRDPGRCYVRAGWTRLEQKTVGGLVVVQQTEAAMPPPDGSYRSQTSLWPLLAAGGAP
jgi:hypothetical protein